MPAHKLLPLVEHLLNEQAQRLPDLHDVVVILPNSGACQQFRQLLLQHLPDGHSALIPPWCGRLGDWLNRQLPAPDATAVSASARRLLFIEALMQHPGLFKRDNSWQVCDALLQLFDELTLHCAPLPGSLEQWHDFLQQAYATAQIPPHLGFEARLVHSLWQAWQQQLGDHQQLDASARYALQLADIAGQTAARLQDVAHVYLAAQDFSAAEQQAIDSMLACGKASLIDCHSHCLHSDFGRFVQHCYRLDTPLKQRAGEVAFDQPPPLKILASEDDETEVAAIDLQIRQWLLQGKTRIAVICEDRRLARRLRALLDRAGVPLQDFAGWSLATTSAAAVIERWLECIEQDFEQHAFLDLLKSRFIEIGDEPDNVLHHVYRLEQDIIRQENIHSGLERYRQQLQRRKQRLLDKLNWHSEHYRQLQQLLRDIGAISQPLRHLYQSAKTRPASTLFDALQTSLQALGITARLQQDAAGQNVLQCLDDMHGALRLADPPMLWNDFRVWLGSELENRLFSPSTGHAAVQLMTLEQADCQSFEAVVLAAVNAGSYPGSAGTAPVFNQAVRSALQLPDWPQQQQRRLQRFQLALLSADEVLITCKHSEKGEPLPPSPWLELLQRFHQRVFGIDATDNTLLAQLRAITGLRQQRVVSPGVSQQPAPAIAASALPQRLSAGGHQRLIDCPYRFFSADVLALRSAEEIRRALQKADYGQRVHRILHIFHQQVEHYPPPFPQPITAADRDAAIAQLREISQRVFRQDIDDNALHKSWLTRWQRHIPAYIDWQIKRAANWRVVQCETAAETTLDENTVLFGRLDRVDSTRDGEHYAIIDYKTGKAPQQRDIESGENVQLASYSLLQSACSEVLYLALDENDDKVKTASRLSDAQLDDIRERSRQRLQTMLQAISRQQPLPAWGEQTVCQHCAYSGLCRRQFWENAAVE